MILAQTNNPIIDKIHLGWAQTFLKHGWFAHVQAQAHAHAQAHSQAHAHAHPYTQYLIKGGLAPLLISYYLYGWAWEWAWAWEYGWAWAWEWAWAWAWAWTWAWANHPCFKKVWAQPNWILSIIGL